MRGLIVLTAAALLGACTATPPPPNPVLANAAAAEQQRHDAKAAEVKAIAAEMPDWYINPPQDDHVLYAAGTANSADLEFALAKAILSAKRSLADRVGGSVSAEHKEFLQEGGNHPQPVLVSDRTTINKIADVVLNGYTVVQTKLVPSDTQYRAFVLLQYPLAGTEPAAAPAKEAEHEAAQDTKDDAAKAFEDLQKDIAKRRNDVTRDDLPLQQP